MSETTSPIAEAMASMDAADAQRPNSAPQAEPIAETPAEPTAPPASAEPNDDAAPEDAHETKSRAEQRIKQLAARDKEAREEIAFLREQLGRQQQPQQPKPEPGPQPLHPDLAQWVGEEPKPEAFPAGEFDPQYLRAIAKHEARHEQAQMTMASRQHAFRQQQEARAKSFFEQADKVAAEKPDFREVVGAFGRSVHDTAAEMVADAGAEVAYAIAKDAEVSARIRAARNPAAVAREIGRMEARLEAMAEAKAAAPAAPPPQPSAAPPPPPRAIRGSSAASFDYATATPAQIQARILGG